MGTKEIKIVSWKDGSWEDIANMIEAHYNGIIHISSYWNTGETKRVELTNGEIVDLVLIGNRHDNLVNSINGITKAAFTIQTKNCLEKKERIFSHNNSFRYSLWVESEVRNFLNIKFKESLPDGLQTLIKPVKKETYRYSGGNHIANIRATVITEDEIFLLSETECYGRQELGTEYKCGRGTDGVQYEYYEINSRIKHLGIDGDSIDWWLRSSIVYSCGYSGFRFVSSYGNVNSNDANLYKGLAPAFCI